MALAADGADFFAIFTIQNPDSSVKSVGDVQEFLFWIAREHRRPDRSLTQRLGMNEELFYKLAVLLKDLNPIAGSVANVNQTIIREVDACHHAAELLRWSFRIMLR